jgi:hypothetical protein
MNIFKFYFLSIFSLILISCSNPTPKPIKSPEWFGKLPHKDFEIIGYGFGENFQEAKERARVDISNQISVKVNSEIEIEAKFENGKNFKAFKEKSSQKSEAYLSNIEIIKVSEDQKYVALKYNNLPFEKKFLSKLGDWKCSKDRFFENTTLGKFAKSKKDCLPKISLFKNKNSIFINSDEVSELLPDLTTLFFNFENEFIILKIPNEIRENIDFDIDFKSSKDGFVSIFLISEKGEVFEILSNHKSKKDTFYSFSKLRDQTLYGKIENGKDFEKSLFFAIFSKKSLKEKFLKIRSEDERISGFGLEKALELFNLEETYFSSSIQYIRK